MSLRFRLSAVICASIIFIGIFSFISITARADKAGNAAKAAEAAVAKAEELAQRCRELEAAAKQAVFELDQANRRLEEAKGTSEEGARAKEQKKALQKQYEATSAANADCGHARDARDAADAAIKKAEEALKEKTDRGGKDDDGLGKALEGLKKRAEALKPKESQENIVPPAAGQPSVVTEIKNGMRVINFNTASGQIRVNLPDDMMAGDTISGTVFTEPKGNTPEEKTQNQDQLNGYVVDLDGTRVPANQPRFTWAPSLPKPNTPVRYSLKIVEVLPGPNPIDRLIGGAVITPNPKITYPTHPSGAVITPGDSPTTPPFIFPPLGQTGRSFEITGPFDGDSSNTTLNWTAVRSAVQDFEKNTENVSGGFGLLAESPRKAVFTAPSNVTGPLELHLKEGQTQTTGNCRNVGVNLSAPKTELRNGEQTTLTVRVVGLQGIRKPVPLTLDAGGVITMEGGMFQPLTIQPSEVGADGSYSTTRGITGVQSGGWTATATVVTQPFNIVLRDLSPPQTLLINSFIGDYVFCGLGPKLTGTGTIKQQGCTFTLNHDAPDRQINGTFDGCNPVDNGKFWVFYSAGTSTDLIVTMTDTQPPKKKVYFNPLGRPAPPVTDVSAFATCP